MKKTVFALTLAASIGLAACSDPGEEVIVSTNVGDITQNEFYEKMKSLAGTQVLQQVVVDQILNDKYKVSDEEIDKEYKVYEDQYGDSFSDILASSGMTEETFRDNIRFSLLQKQAIADAVTDEAIQAYYDQASQELHARHILVATEEEATAIIEELKGGADFAEVAKEKSTDTASGAEGGDLGWFTVGKMVPEFNDAAYALELNTVSEPVQSEFGFHIIEVLEKRDLEGYGSLEDKKEEIRETLTTTQADWATVQADLIKEAKVDVKDEDLKDTF